MPEGSLMIVFIMRKMKYASATYVDLIFVP